MIRFGGLGSRNRGISLGELKVLASSPRNGGEDAVQRYFELREARAMSLAKGAGGAFVSLLTAWLVPLLKNDFAAHSLWVAIVPPVALLVLFVVAAALAWQESGKAQRSLVRALAMLQLFR